MVMSFGLLEPRRVDVRQQMGERRDHSENLRALNEIPVDLF
jgi:hypothetical protein